MNNNNETKDEEKSLSIQKTLSRVNLSSIVNSDTQNNTVLTNRVLLDPIWNKLYPYSTKNGDDKTKKETTSEGRKKEKKVKIVDYINKSREILAMKFNIKNKLKRFQNLKNLKNNQINILDKLRQNFVNSKNYISENYHSNYISYLHHINQIIEDETIIANKIIQEKLKLKKEIGKLIDKVRKLIEKKCMILLWVSLQIHVKEKIMKIPDSYFKILESDDHHKVYNKSVINKDYYEKLSSITDCSSKTKKISEKRIIKKKERDRILDYKRNPIYDTADDFLAQFNKIQNNSLYNLNILYKQRNEINSLKEQYLSIMDFYSYEDETRQMQQKLDDIRNINTQLQSQLENLDIKRTFRKKIINYSKSSSNSLDIISNQIKKDLIYRQCFSNSNNHSTDKNFYNISNFSSYFNFKNKKIYSLIFDLFHMCKQNNLISFESFKTGTKINDNYLINIMSYIEKVINMLLEEIHYYNSNPKLNILYRKVKLKVIKENHQLKFFYLLRMEDLKKEAQIKQIEKRLNKIIYSPTKKIDYYSFPGTTKNMKIKSLDVKKNDKSFEPSLEDFLFSDNNV